MPANNKLPTEATPGVIPETGELIATVNGNKVTEGVVDAVLAQVPEAQRAEIKSGPQYSRLKEQLVTTEILYREALKQGFTTKKTSRLRWLSPKEKSGKYAVVIS